MTWWVWVLIGFALLGLELAATTLHLAFFGIGALILGAVVGLGYDGPLWTQLLMFTVVSVLLLLFRQPLLKAMKYGPDAKNVDSLVGETALVLEEMAPNALGRAELRGSAWSARNIGDRPLVRGERAQVASVEGLTLCVRPS
jgi:membrane protein implicated in regulation of membrane protease activity